MVKVTALKVADPGFISAFSLGIIPESSHTSDLDLEIGTKVAGLPSVWCHKVSAGTGTSGRPSVSIL